MLDTHRPSALELDLKRIVHSHPESEVRYESPSGPFVRAVLWGAGDDGEIVGQTYWCTDSSRWVTRAFDTTIGEASIVMEHPATREDLSESITRVIARLQNPRLFALENVAPDLADVVRSLGG
ncbi:hypothetical protein [Nocardiopsis sp. NPDC006938]|uniref:hypothetical protein n=1 Tax=Nocardiopsis sp. NPDC006938 TaxID=3364337 RepID=UPI0036837298